MAEIRGFIDDIRDLGGLIFIKMNTDTGYGQITIHKNTAKKELLETVRDLTRQSCIVATGTEKEFEKGRKELIPDEIRVLTKSIVPLPMDPSGKVPAEFDTRLNWRSLDLRNYNVKVIFKVQSSILQGMYNYFNANAFTQVFTPSLMGAPGESGSELFSIPYYDKEAFLRQDPQLHRELTILGGFEKIFEIGPSWRAEVSHTTRHLSEHRTCAAEIAYIKDERDIMRLEEGMVISVFKHVKENCKEELEQLNVDLKIPKENFPVIEFPKLYDILDGMGKKLKHGADIDKEGEELLAKHVEEKYKSEFFFINRFPFAVKPFYVMRVDDEPKWARSIDLEYKGMEMSSGGQREHRYEKLESQIREKGLNTSNFEWFIRFFRYGSPPMGGFSIGIERLTEQILDLKNVREAVLFPRDPERLLP